MSMSCCNLLQCCNGLCGLLYMQDGILLLGAPYMETRFHNAGRLETTLSANKEFYQSNRLYIEPYMLYKAV